MDCSEEIVRLKTLDQSQNPKPVIEQLSFWDFQLSEPHIEFLFSTDRPPISEIKVH